MKASITTDKWSVEREGDSGLIAVLQMEGPYGKPFINIEWDTMDMSQAVTILKDIMLMMHENMPGVVQNATLEFAKEAGMMDDKGNVRLKFKQADHKPTDYKFSSKGESH